VNFNPNELGWISPFLILAVAGMLLVLAEAFYKGRDRTALCGMAVAGSLASAIASIILYRQLAPGETHALFTDADATGQIHSAMLIADKTGYILSALFGVITALTALMSPAH